jgi:hypothetical protein
VLLRNRNWPGSFYSLHDNVRAQVTRGQIIGSPLDITARYAPLATPHFNQ